MLLLLCVAKLWSILMQRNTKQTHTHFFFPRVIKVFFFVTKETLHVLLSFISFIDLFSSNCYLNTMKALNLICIC